MKRLDMFETSLAEADKTILPIIHSLLDCPFEYELGSTFRVESTTKLNTIRTVYQRTYIYDCGHGLCNEFGYTLPNIITGGIVPTLYHMLKWSVTALSNAKVDDRYLRFTVEFRFYEVVKNQDFVGI